jgi:hypothetical protein
MNYRHTFNGLPIQFKLEDMYVDYLERMEEMMERALDEHPRTFAVRIDCRLPEQNDRDDIFYVHIDDRFIMRDFSTSLKSKIEAQNKRKKREGVRVRSNRTRKIWCRERKVSQNYHYHLVLCFNKDKFWKLGDFKNRDSLASKVIEAWASALGIDFEDAVGLVHFPEKGAYLLDINDKHFGKYFDQFFYRISYLAKKETKYFEDGRRNFGCSPF